MVIQRLLKVTRIISQYSGIASTQNAVKYRDCFSLLNSTNEPVMKQIATKAKVEVDVKLLLKTSRRVTRASKIKPKTFVGVTPTL